MQDPQRQEEEEGGEVLPGPNPVDLIRWRQVLIDTVRRGPEHGVSWHHLRRSAEANGVPTNNIFYDLLETLINDGRIIKLPHWFMIRRTANRRRREEENLMRLHAHESTPFRVRATAEERLRILDFIRRARNGVTYNQIHHSVNMIPEPVLRREIRALVEERRIRQRGDEKFLI
ncbi:hypothetical protein AVEN_265311-1 [Araneus ventricosus]|uniref:Uncharacterized protein n=1 Tax=Araneus ventricosus TaxID=182803 RepID=A0A4Y2EM69_ARAVE|nr:hypothetical protein AVEN_265311-1 [Araneus ventricosus]